MATYGATTTDEKRETSSGRRAPAAAIAAALVVLAVASSSGVSLKPTLRGAELYNRGPKNKIVKGMTAPVKATANVMMPKPGEVAAPGQVAPPGAVAAPGPVAAPGAVAAPGPVAPPASTESAAAPDGWTKTETATGVSYTREKPKKKVPRRAFSTTVFRGRDRSTLRFIAQDPVVTGPTMNGNPVSFGSGPSVNGAKMSSGDAIP